MNATAHRYRIALLPGDGIGPEVMAAGRRVMDDLARRRGIAFEYAEYAIGGAALDAHGVPLRPADLDLMRSSDAVLLAALGGPKWDTGPANLRPEAGLLALRKGLGAFANLRPARIFPDLVSASKLKPEIAARVDLIVFRELTGGLYFGEPRGRGEGEREKGRKGEREKGKTAIGRTAYNTMIYSEEEIRRIAKMAFEAARGRRKRVTSVDKANVLEVSQLWREVVTEVARDYPDVELLHLYVDNAAMQLVRDPGQFDVLLTENLFGDILSDLCAELVGSIGLLPSACLGASGPGLFEPVHGSAPDIAGKGLANPLAMFLTIALMFRHGLKRPDLADEVERGVAGALKSGLRTRDLGGAAGTAEVTERVIQKISEEA
ncbi:3-isopropylmalate dehydrogenase [bacterium]|nr:3-isopropylmalate dehydrogenase [bacterium]